MHNEVKEVLDEILKELRDMNRKMDALSRYQKGTGKPHYPKPKAYWESNGK